MARFITAILLVIALPVFASAQDDRPPNIGQQMLEFVTAMHAQDPVEAQQVGRNIRDNPVFSNLPHSTRVEFLVELLGVEAVLGDREAALLLLSEIEALSTDENFIIAIRIHTRVRLEDYLEAADPLLQLLARNRSRASFLYWSSFDRIIGALAEVGEYEQVVALITTAEGMYRDTAPEWSDAYRRLELARAFIGLGLEDRAASELRTIRTPDLLARIRYDREFEFLWQAPEFDEWSNVRAATEAEIERLDIIIADNPHFLSPIRARVMALSALGRDDEALRAAESAADRVENGPPWRDQNDQANWLYDALAALHYESGRFDEGNAAMERAMSLNEGQMATNVSQTINYGLYLFDQGQDDAAQNLVERLQDFEMSIYGERWATSLLACIAYQDDRNEDYRELREQLRQDSFRNRAALRQAYLCAGDEDGITEIVIEQLGDEDARAEILEEFQQYSAGGVFPMIFEHETDRSRAARELWMRVRDRADVREVAGQHIRRQDFHVNHLIYTGP